ncbi:MAG: hypothetical protein JNK60_13990 [Acidobacteria bacterium]|nr:hypothetical protein [Acidobacteriota bacterium]
MAPRPALRKAFVDPFVVASREDLRGVDLVRDDILPVNCGSCPPGEVRFRSRNVSNLVPDRRFLIAVLEVRALAGRPVRRLTLSRQGASWSIALDGVSWGRFEELADFEALFSRLQEEAGERPRSKGTLVPVPPGEPLVPVHLARHIRSVDALWVKAPGDPALAAAAARSFTFWALLSRDRTGGSDALFGKALALLAIARGGGNPMPAEEALLAHAMGYRAAAERLSERLSGNDPIRAYCRADSKRLGLLAAEANASREAQLLIVVHQARTRGRNAMAGTLATSPLNTASGIGVAHVLLDFTDFGTKEELLTVVGKAVLEELELLGLSDSGAAPRNSEAVDRAFEKATKESWGPLLDPATLRGFAGGTYATATVDRVRHELYDRGSPDWAASRLRDLKASDPALWGRLHEWLDAEIAFARSPTVQAASIMASAMLRASLGPLPIEELQERFQETSGTGAKGNENREALPATIAILDARPDRVALAAMLFGSALRDLARRDALLEGILRRSPGLHLGRDLDAAQNLKDAVRLDRIARDSTADGWVRVRAVLSLEELSGARFGDLEKRLEQIVVEDEDRGTAVFEASTALRKRGNRAGSIRLLDRFLALRPVPQDPLWANAQSIKGLHMRRLGRSPKEVWEVVEPTLVVGSATALLEGVRCQIALGNLGLAEVMARDLAERYGSGSGVRARAEVEWARGKPEAAARILAEGAARLGRGGFHESVPEALEGLSGETRSGALRALSAVSFDGLFRHDLALGILERGDAAASCEVAGGPTTGTAAAQSMAVVIRYVACRQAGREQAVVAELVGEGRSQPHQVALTAFSLGAYDALWDLFPGDGVAGAANAGALSYIRAAAILDGPVQKAAERRGALLAWARETSDGFGPYVRFLLGDLDEAGLPSPDEAARPTYGHSLGLMALSRCQPELANEWLQVALWGNNVPTSWSRQLTDRLLQARSALSLVSARDLEAPALGKAPR